MSAAGLRRHQEEHGSKRVRGRATTCGRIRRSPGRPGSAPRPRRVDRGVVALDNPCSISSHGTNNEAVGYGATTVAEGLADGRPLDPPSSTLVELDIPRP